MKDLTPLLRTPPRSDPSWTFEVLSRVLVLLMTTAFLLSSLLLLPASWYVLDEEALSWCAAVFLASLVVTLGISVTSPERR